MSAPKKIHEPPFHIVKRPAIAPWKALLIRAIAIAAALAVSSLVLFVLTKKSPFEAMRLVYEASFGVFNKNADRGFFAQVFTGRRFWAMLQDLCMLLVIALAVTPAFKMKYWNLGAQGQVLFGGLCSVAVMFYLSSGYWETHKALVLLLMIAAAVAGGIVWAVIPALFKARWNTNESLFTLMMNYIAIRLTAYFVAKWENPYGSNTVGIINSQSRFGWFPKVFDQQYGLNVILVLALTVFIFIYLKYTKHGFEIAVVGDSENTARYCAIDVKKVIIRTMMLSGAICGIAGFLAVAGAGHTISTDTAGGRGFTTIIVAWMSKFNSFIMAAVSAFLVFLEKGAMQIASQYQLSDYISNVVKGIILIFLLGSEFFVNFKVRLRGSHK